MRKRRYLHDVYCVSVKDSIQQKSSSCLILFELQFCDFTMLCEHCEFQTKTPESGITKMNFFLNNLFCTMRKNISLEIVF